MAATSLAVTVSHAVAYIMRPLLLRSSTATLLKLQLALEASLTAYYASSWNPSEPLQGSGRRCMTLSPASHPPRPLFAACRAANIEWADWIAALGGIEFDLFVDPGCVSVRFGRWGAGPFSKLIPVWSGELDREPSTHQAVVAQPAVLPMSPAFVEALHQKDEDDGDELLAMIADEMAAPTWKTPKTAQFPVAPRSTISSHSRSSSSSGLSSDDDYSLFDDDSDAASSITTASSAPTDMSKLSRRERARLARVYVDTSKKEVTNYDGGKTSVLTGGVMLGAPPKPAKAAPKPSVHAKVFVPKLSAPPMKVSSSPWIRQPLGPAPGLSWRIRA